MDEATSALDEASEKRLYELVAQRLPGATLVSIAHRPAVAAYHRKRFSLVPDGERMRLADAPASGAARTDQESATRKRTAPGSSACPASISSAVAPRTSRTVARNSIAIPASGWLPSSTTLSPAMSVTV